MYPSFQVRLATQVCTRMRQNQFLFKTMHTPWISKHTRTHWHGSLRVNCSHLKQSRPHSVSDVNYEKVSEKKGVFWSLLMSPKNLHGVLSGFPYTRGFHKGFSLNMLAHTLLVYPHPYFFFTGISKQHGWSHNQDALQVRKRCWPLKRYRWPLIHNVGHGM